MTTRQYFSREVYEACYYGSAFSVEEAIQREIELTPDYRVLWNSMTGGQADRFISEVHNHLKRDFRNVPKFSKGK